MAQTYQATARREGAWWIIAIPELGAVTQARNVREIETMAQGLVTALLDLDSAARVDVTLELPEAAGKAWREAERLQRQAEADSRRAAGLRRSAVRSLLGDHRLTQADASALLGISHQRVQQLAKSK
ncbi:MAG: hypothetical protein LBG60_09545 [Bifidobacteriaceae bacterium]|jgi:transcriptional regulator with PAS, ATPase and Fis domain|nr:hypothetical protein [Bifidobacteriaceae bacterium]